MTTDVPTQQNGTNAAAPEPPPTRDSWMLAAVTISALSLLAAIVAVGIGVSAADRNGGGSGVATGGEVTIEVELGDLYIEPAVIEVPAGAEATFVVTNVGAMPHDFVLGTGEGTEMLDPGESETFTSAPISADTEAWCTVPGHREGGMEADVVVLGGESAASGDHTTHDAAGSGAGTDGSDGNAVIDFNAVPGDDWEPFDPALEPAPGATEHEITLTAEETVIEVAPGVTQELWTFNQQFPGPVLRGKVGDIFTVTLVNEGEMGHSIDFHSSKVAWNDEMRTIQPGESLVYQYEAKHAGVYMYHCGTPPALHHVGNGMFGAIIIDPPDLEPVDKEYIFVQSEMYMGPEGEPGSLAKMQDFEFDTVVFNGYVNQYVHEPIEVEVDERIRLFVLNAGPSENSSFHVIGTIFDTVYKEGSRLLEPDETQGGSQALDLQPAQGGYVEFTFDEEGYYVAVTHKFSNVGLGAMGLFQAGDPGPLEGGGH